MNFLFREFASTEIESRAFANGFDCQSYYSAAGTRLRFITEVRLRGNFVQTTVQILSLTTGWQSIYFAKSNNQSRRYDIEIPLPLTGTCDVEILTVFIEKVEAKILEKVIMLIDG